MEWSFESTSPNNALSKYGDGFKNIQNKEKRRLKISAPHHSPLFISGFQPCACNGITEPPVVMRLAPSLSGTI